MATKKQRAQTTAPPEPPAATPPPAEVRSTNLDIQRVDNGFLLKLSLDTGNGYAERRQMVAKDAADLARIVSQWAAPPAKPTKR